MAPEGDLYAAALLARAVEPSAKGAHWGALSPLSRREKLLMRRLLALDIPFYSPFVAKRNRSSSGRVRVSHVPLFGNYGFRYGNEALGTNCISRCLATPYSAELTQDLRQIRRPIEVGSPLTPEGRLERCETVRVRSGAF